MILFGSHARLTHFICKLIDELRGIFEIREMRLKWRRSEDVVQAKSAMKFRKYINLFFFFTMKQGKERKCLQL